MLYKRIIPCLDVMDGRTVKGINFVNLRDAGDPVELGKAYAAQGADELVFLDITATVEKRKTLKELVQNVASQINIPFTVGGGITSIEDVETVLMNGADKVAVNSAAVRNPALVNAISERFGNQCLVIAIDTKNVDGEELVHVKGGREATTINTYEWAKEMEERGAGELLLTSMDADGTKAGFAMEVTRRIAEMVDIPVIASGGAGSTQHFLDLFSQSKAAAGLAASIFHFGEIPVPQLKQELLASGVATRSI